MFHTMEDILNDLHYFHGGHRFTQGGFASGSENGFANFARFPGKNSPKVNMYKAKDHLLVTCRLPGVRPENVEVTLNQDVLTIKGKTEQAEEDADYYHRERISGSFTRKLSLPFVVPVSDSIDAQLRDGLLQVKLQIPEESQARKIEVSA